MSDAKKKSVFLVISILFIAACLRGPVTGIGPLVTTLEELLSISGTAAGLLTTLPMLTFAAVSFAVAPIARKIGIGKLMFLSLIVLFLGLLIRSFLGTTGLFIGTVVLAAGIGTNNVLLPVVVKSEFPAHVGTLTGAYTTLMAGFASLSSGTSVPLSNAFNKLFGNGNGWRAAICVWLVLVVFAFIFWLPNINQSFDAARAENPSAGASPDVTRNKASLFDDAAGSDPASDAAGFSPLNKKRRSVAHSPISWYISLFMGFQSMVFYFTVAWFATILQSCGFSKTASGIFNMIMMLCGLPAAFVMPIIASRTKHQSFWGAFIGACYAAGMVSLFFASHPAGLVITILTNGIGSGAAIAFCMVLFALHTKDASDASSLSSMAQGIGYIMAAVSPVFVGLLEEMTGSWTIPLIFMTVIGLATTVFGFLSGINKIVET